MWVWHSCLKQFSAFRHLDWQYSSIANSVGKFFLHCIYRRWEYNWQYLLKFKICIKNFLWLYPWHMEVPGPGIESMCWTSNQTHTSTVTWAAAVRFFFFFFLNLYLWHMDVSQARNQIGAAATGLHHSHSNSNAGFEPHLWLFHSLWQCQILNPLNEARDWTSSSGTLDPVLNPLSHNGNAIHLGS